MEIATAVEVARRGALALDNARLYERQLKVAETLQRNLLTPAPQPDHLEIAVRYRPATAHALVGGDFYDAFTQPDGATLLVVGDVAGHSVEAAAAMSQLRSALRTLAYDRPDSPATTLGRVDRVLTGLDFGTLATALIARIEQTDEQSRQGLRTLRWSSAGHLPPLLLRADGTVQPVGAPGTLLGVLPDPSFEDRSLSLAPGDAIVFYTDGVIEGRGANTALDEEGLAQLVAACAGEGADSIAARVEDAAVAAQDGSPRDDIAVLVLRVAP
jgi:serine phosphatase RsbU (regulator of sigma subunit)